jgi:hypothetical protein
MFPNPATWLSVPLSIIEREGEHVALTPNCVNRTPTEAKASMLGVRISLPKLPMSAIPASSATMSKMFGRASCAELAPKDNAKSETAIAARNTACMH